MIDASQGLHQGRQQEPPARAGHPPDRGYLHAAGRQRPRYARLVPVDEIADRRTTYNLNLPRYIDSTEPEDMQDIDGHLRGGIPDARPRRARALTGRLSPAVRAALFKQLTAPATLELQLPIARGEARHLRSCRVHRFQCEGDAKLFANGARPTRRDCSKASTRTAIPRRSSKPSPRTCSPPSRPRRCSMPTTSIST